MKLNTTLKRSRQYVSNKQHTLKRYNKLKFNRVKQAKQPNKIISRCNITGQDPQII